MLLGCLYHRSQLRAIMCALVIHISLKETQASTPGHPSLFDPDPLYSMYALVPPVLESVGYSISYYMKSDHRNRSRSRRFRASPGQYLGYPRPFSREVQRSRARPVKMRHKSCESQTGWEFNGFGNGRTEENDNILYRNVSRETDSQGEDGRVSDIWLVTSNSCRRECQYHTLKKSTCRE